MAALLSGINGHRLERGIRAELRQNYTLTCGGEVLAVISKKMKIYWILAYP
jgi:hypothetical protein